MGFLEPPSSDADLCGEELLDLPGILKGKELWNPGEIDLIRPTDSESGTLWWLQKEDLEDQRRLVESRLSRGGATGLDLL